MLARAPPTVAVLLAAAPLAATDEWVAAFRRSGVARSKRLAEVVRTASACVGHAELRSLRARLPAAFTPAVLLTDCAVRTCDTRHHPLAHADLLCQCLASGVETPQLLDAVGDLDNDDLRRERGAFDEPVRRAFVDERRRLMLEATVLTKLHVHEQYIARAALARVRNALLKNNTAAAQVLLKGAPCCRETLHTLLGPLVEAGNARACEWLLRRLDARPAWSTVKSLIRVCADRDVENWLVSALWH